jgi:hypothetical protein
MNFNKKSLKSFALILMLLTCSVNASTFSWVDDFEDGELTPWQGGVLQVFSPGADASQYAMNMRSGKAEVSFGAYARPTEFSFYFRSNMIGAAAQISLRGDGPNPPMKLTIIREKVILAGTTWSYVVDPLVWHKLAIADIDWQKKQFNIKIDDQVLAENMKFSSLFIDGFVKTILFTGSRFLIDNVELVGDLATDIEKPTITLLTPTPESTVPNPVLISGNTEDAGGLARIGLSLFAVNLQHPVAFGEQKFNGELASPWQFEFNNLAANNYRVELKCEDLAGNSIKLISKFVVSEGNGNPDTTPPSTPIVTDSGETTTDLTTLSASVDTADAESGITALQYSVGTSALGNDVRDWTQIAYSQNLVIGDLNLQKEKTYYINVRAINGTNLVSEIGTSDGIKALKTTDTTPPSTPLVEDDGEVIQEASVLHAKWNSTDLESEIVEYKYSVGTAPGSENIVAWVSTGTDKSFQLADLPLVIDETIYVNVAAKNSENLWSAVGSSNGIRVIRIADTTPPLTPVVTDAGDTTTSTTELPASWISEDSESAIVAYRVSVGTTQGSDNIAPWSTDIQATSTVINNLILAVGKTYYINVVAINADGLTSQAGSSDGIKVVRATDKSPPIAPLVDDMGSETFSTTQLRASWMSSDAESAIVEYRYAIGTAPFSRNIVDWTSAGAATDVTHTGLELAVGLSYYISVVAINEDGLLSEAGTSDGIRVVQQVDVTPPSIPIVTDEGVTTSQRQRLYAEWQSADPESGIASYSYSVGTTSGATDVVAWTNIGTQQSLTITEINLLVGQTYYINLRAYNTAGLISEVGTSDGIKVVEPEQVDTTAPTIEVSSPQNNASISLNNATLQVTGTATDDRQLKRVVVVLLKMIVINGKEFPKFIATNNAELLPATNWKAAFGITEIGKYTINARAFDGSDNKSDIVKNNFEIIALE